MPSPIGSFLTSAGEFLVGFGEGCDVICVKAAVGDGGLDLFNIGTVGQELNPGLPFSKKDHHFQEAILTLQVGFHPPLAGFTKDVGSLDDLGLNGFDLTLGGNQ